MRMKIFCMEYECVTSNVEVKGSRCRLKRGVNSRTRKITTFSQLLDQVRSFRIFFQILREIRRIRENVRIFRPVRGGIKFDRN
jgi:hypothetical protein